MKSRGSSLMIKNKFECVREGLTIRGMEFRPQGDHLPIAIICHGFMANYKTVVHYAKAFAEAGYASYCFDFIGGSVMMSKSDGKTTDMSVITETRDLECVIEYTQNLEYTDEKEIVLMGCSQGGFVAALTAAKLKEKIAGLILFYPALCIPDDARAGKMMFAKFDPANVPEMFYCGPMKLGTCYVSDVLNMDPYEEIKEYAGPVLIVHGSNDKIVKTDYIERACEVYRKRDSKEKVTLHIIEKGNHGFSKKHDQIAIGYIKEFIGDKTL
ncbi:MAG: lysophospholipase [Lachnospiraceae bacterium]|nr:lysophospholipase [Lachnospiraceae bacterium]